MVFVDGIIGGRPVISAADVRSTLVEASRALLQREIEYRANPLNWEAPESRLLDTVGEKSVWVACPACDFQRLHVNLLSFSQAIVCLTEYHLHWYREHAYRNWSA